jgi:hypothetical protein
MTLQLHDTMMGKKLIEGTLPDIAHQLKRIADILESKQQDQVTSAFKAYVNSGATDSEIVKQLREIWQK